MRVSVFEMTLVGDDLRVAGPATFEGKKSRVERGESAKRARLWPLVVEDRPLQLVWPFQ